MTRDKIGVCSWSLDRHDAIAAIRKVADAGLGLVQVGFFTAQALQEAKAIRIAQAARTAGVGLCGVFLAFEHEDYNSIARISETGGLAPDDLADARLALVHQAAELTAGLSCASLAIHAGTIPADASSPTQQKLLDRVGKAADSAREFGLRLSLETGRESIETLVAFIDALNRDNVVVNFDPANLVLYGVDEPARAVARLRGRIEIVHVKDAKRPSQAGMLGKPAPIGTGDAEIPRVISKMRTIGYDGPLLIETRNDNGPTDVREAAAYLRTLLI